LYKTYEERQRLQQEILAFEIWREVWYSWCGTGEGNFAAITSN
jgi:hypothetical protein